jgi:hypothetical protein
MEYVARAPAPALESIVDGLYYLAGTPPYPRLTIIVSVDGFIATADDRRSAAAIQRRSSACRHPCALAGPAWCVRFVQDGGEWRG